MAERLQIAVVGRMNAGKSTFTNALTQNKTSIVDATPGTTADAKISLIEIHGLGACKIFDTAGLDEAGLLGLKKRQKTLKILHQADVVCLIENLSQNDQNGDSYKSLVSEYQMWLNNPDKSYDFNVLQTGVEFISNTSDRILQECKSKNKRVITIQNDLNGDGSIKQLAFNIINTNMNKTDQHQLALKIKDVANYKQITKDQFLPQFLLESPGHVLLIIPLDAQSPKLRLLRPQQMAIEALLSSKCQVTCFQLNLKAARGQIDKAAQIKELTELDNIIANINTKLLITDSQAMDIVRNYSDKTNVTTFSVMQQHLLLKSDLFDYTKCSIKKFDELVRNQPHKLKILISEACQHDRITQNCEDIGTKQLPAILKKLFNNTQIELINSFGKDDELMDLKFDLVIHCGGCMISGQQMRSRVGGFKRKNIPVISYGQVFAYNSGGLKGVQKVEQVW